MRRGLFGVLVSRPVLVGLALIALAWIAHWAFMRMMGFGGGPPGGVMVIPVEAAYAERMRMAETLTLVGQVEALHGADVRAEVAGRVVGVGAADGSEVKQGDVLFRLDDSVARAQLAQAEATLQVALNTAKRNARLVQVGAVSKQQAETASAEAKLAQANVQLAKASLEKTVIMAPFDGQLGVGRVNVGSYVTPGTALTTVTDAVHVKVIFDMPERYATLPVGTLVSVMADLPQGEAVAEGTLLAVDGKSDPVTHTVQARVDVDNQRYVLVPGQFVRVRVDTRVVDNALVIPDMALVPQGETMFVFVVQPGAPAMASRTEVRIGLRGNNRVELLGDAVKAGQQVVTAGQQKLQAPVMPVTVSSPSVITVAPSPIEQLK